MFISFNVTIYYQPNCNVLLFKKNNFIILFFSKLNMFKYLKVKYIFLCEHILMFFGKIAYFTFLMNILEAFLAISQCINAYKFKSF